MTENQDESHVLCKDVHIVTPYRLDMRKSGDFSGLDVGQRVRELRKAKGWGQEQLAEKAGVSDGTVKMIESGKRHADFGKLSNVLAALGVEIQIQEIAGKKSEEKEAPKGPTPGTIFSEAVLILQAYETAKPEQKKKVLEELGIDLHTSFGQLRKFQNLLSDHGEQAHPPKEAPKPKSNK